MKKFRFKDRRRRYQIIPAIAIIISIFFLIYAFTLSFSKEIGQAKVKMKKSIISGIYSNIMDSGSALVAYQSADKKHSYPFPLNLASNFYNLHQYVSASISLPKKYDTLITKEEVHKQVDITHINNGNLTKEYILTNGAILDKKEYQEYLEAEVDSFENTQELPVVIMEGAIDQNQFYIGKNQNAIETMRTFNGTPFTLEQLKDFNFLISHFYIIDPSTKVTDNLFNSEQLLKKDMTIKTTNDKPQILIYHTHSQEAFLDSREGIEEDTVVGIGDLLAEILEEKYGYNVIHDRSVYDLVDGKLDRNQAYNYARKSIKKILDKHPSIEVVIDLHRDGAKKRSTYIKGEETAQIMLLNGLSRNQNGPISRLDNPYLQDNLAFSLQLQLKSLELYPGLLYKNYLQAYRYNLDLRPKSILMELGTHKNSLKSAKNAIEPFADILNAVLKGE